MAGADAGHCVRVDDVERASSRLSSPRALAD